MKFNKTLFFLFLPLVFLKVPNAFCSVELPKQQKEETSPVQARLVSEQETIQPGRPFWVGVELKMAKGWDTYWVNPGDSGFPTTVNWQLPDGFKVGPLKWPYPEKITNDSLVAFGYTDSVLLLAEITPSKDLPKDLKIELKADVNWLACSDSCVPGMAELSLPLTVSNDAPKISEQASALFAQARSALPQKLSSDEKVTLHAQKEEIVLNFTPKPGAFGEIEDLLFIPEVGEVIDYSAPQSFKQASSAFVLKMKRAHSGSEIPKTVSGVLLVSEKGSSIKKAIQVESSLSSGHVEASDKPLSVPLAILFAFVGGLILNAMPCVLPVIALKIFGFVKMAGERRRVIFQQGAVFSLGVLVSFWVLAGGLFILRAYGQSLGWGFQLQEPIFVAILASVLFLLGLSLFGVFELGTSLISLGNKGGAKNSPLKSSFMSGVLATLVATPCTGPLLGPALGLAMTLPAFVGLVIFTSMGLGMASPYLLFSLFPKLVRFLPKPGNWMVAFKQIMGFLMMATVCWLVWVFGAQTDNVGTFILLASLLLLAIGAWIFGKWGAPSRKKITRRIALVLSVFVMLLAGMSTIMTAKQHRIGSGAPQGKPELVMDSGWSAYSPERVDELTAKGVPVFVDFTAKWCLICQANKAILHSSDVEKTFKEKGVVTMTADWTKKDPIITKELQKLGRTGVPVYVLYPAGSNKPQILPQTLTAKVVKNYLEKLPSHGTIVYAD